MMLYKISAKWDDTNTRDNDPIAVLLDNLSGIGCYDVEIDELQEKPKPHVGGGKKKK